jgi:anthranilate synthase/aminodeoxychorismate synthase-like glutamine amidotransferase
MEKKNRKVLFIDNFDSFTYNLVDDFKDKLPILGVCLGHQVIVQNFGGNVSHAPEPMHGKPSRVVHNGKGIFEGIENPLQAGRYHSLCAIDLPECLEKTAEFEGVVMGVQHKNLSIYGVQFHPESILTPAGGKLIENILKIAEKTKQEGKA